MKYWIRHETAGPWYGQAIWLCRWDPMTRKSQVAKPVVLEWAEKEEFGMLPEPTYIIRGEDLKVGSHEEFLRALADFLNEVKINPSIVMNNEKEVTAMKSHIEDLRLIATRLLPHD